jgi:general stress protein CsbA
MERQYYKYVAVMMTCFVLGGFALMLYFLQLYSIFWQSDMVASVIIRDNGMEIPVFSGELLGANESRPGRISNPSGLLYSPFSMILLFIGVVSMLAGFSIWSLIREKEAKHMKRSMISMLLLPDEKMVLDEIEKYGGSVTQSELVKGLGLTRVKVHRIVRNLEKKNLVLKNEYGMTNKITLRK